MDLNKNYFIVGFICLCIGASISLFKKPQIEYKEVIKVEIKEVEKQSIKKDTITKIKEVINLDGSKTIETEIVDKDIIDTEKNKSTQVDSQKDYKSKITNKHRLQLYESVNKVLDFHTHLNYTYKILDPVFIQGDINNKMDYSLRVGIEWEF